MSATAPSTTVPWRAVDRDDVALARRRVADPEQLVGRLMRHGLGADDRRLAPTAGDHRGVADEAAAGGQDALGGEHPVHVLGRGLVAHEDHVVAAGGRGRGVVRGEADAADGRTRRGAEALRRAR